MQGQNQTNGGGEQLQIVQLFQPMFENLTVGEGRQEPLIQKDAGKQQRCTQSRQKHVARIQRANAESRMNLGDLHCA